MNRLPIEKRAQIVTMLVEGMSMRSVSRVADVSINTVAKLLAEVGAACSEYMDKTMRNLTITQVQVDETWAFIGAKEKNVPEDADPMRCLVDCYTYTAIDPVTKLMPYYMLGYRNRVCAEAFIADLASRLSNRVQLTTDGMGAYPSAVEKAFGVDVDYAILNKSYAAGPAYKEAKRRHSPAECTGVERIPVCGIPFTEQISTSDVERANLSMRIGMRRFTRLTNAFSKKIEMHMHAISLHFLHYNFARIHKTIKTAPAMAAGIADNLWTIEEIVRLAPEPLAKKRGAYKPRQPKASAEISN